MERDNYSEKRFVTGILPWIVAGGGLVIYLLTLNSWVNFSSLAPVMKAAGWDWQPSFYNPLYWLVTLPFRWLPISLIPVALNVFSAVCACLTLALLARSIALLPHDRTEEQRIRERSDSSILTLRFAWVPPLVAALVCGLQLTFWENATAASSEMFDVLVFAYVIRCLLEFRREGRETWLLKSSLVYGAAMANNFAMVGFFPLFLVALVWIKGLGFFDLRFLSRMFALGAVGLLAYLLLPIVSAFSSCHAGGFLGCPQVQPGGTENRADDFCFQQGAAFPRGYAALGIGASLAAADPPAGHPLASVFWRPEPAGGGTHDPDPPHFPCLAAGPVFVGGV